MLLWKIVKWLIKKLDEVIIPATINTIK